jgi:hypothetical protein
VQRFVLCRGRSLSVGDVAVTLNGDAEFVEVAFDGDRASVVSHNPDAVAEILIGGKSVWQP